MPGGFAPGLDARPRRRSRRFPAGCRATPDDGHARLQHHRRRMERPLPVGLHGTGPGPTGPVAGGRLRGRALGHLHGRERPGPGCGQRPGRPRRHGLGGHPLRFPDGGQSQPAGRQRDLLVHRRRRPLAADLQRGPLRHAAPRVRGRPMESGAKRLLRAGRRGRHRMGHVLRRLGGALHRLRPHLGAGAAGRGGQDRLQQQDRTDPRRQPREGWCCRGRHRPGAGRSRQCRRPELSPPHLLRRRLRRHRVDRHCPGRGLQFRLRPHLDRAPVPAGRVR